MTDKTYVLYAATYDSADAAAEDLDALKLDTRNFSKSSGNTNCVTCVRASRLLSVNSPRI